MQKNFKNVISTIMWYIPSALRNFKDLTHKTIYHIPSKEDFYHPKHSIYYLSKEIFRQHAASIYGFFRQSVSSVSCVKKKI